MSKRIVLLLLILFWLIPVSAHAQNHTCATRAPGDSSNACASTAFVHGGFLPSTGWTPNQPLIGSGGGGVTQGTRSGTTTVYPVIDGTSTNGQCAVFDSSGGLTSVSCSPSGSGTVGSGLAGQSAQYLTNSTSVFGVSQCLNIQAFGGNPTGTVANDTAFAAAWAALPTFTGGCIYFPAGRYKFTGSAAETLSAHQGIRFQGDGSGSTTLFFANDNIGIAMTWVSADNVVQIRGLKITTGVASTTSVGVFLTNMTGLYGAEVAQNDMIDVVIEGDDFVTGTPTTDHWASGFTETAVSNITFDRVIINGKWAAPGDAAANQIGVSLSGDPTHSLFSTVININNSQINNQGIGILYGSLVQGVIVHNTNFQGAVGTFGIDCPVGSTSPDGLTVTNSQFNIGGDQLQIDCSMGDLIVSHNIMILQKNGEIGVVVGSGSHPSASSVSDNTILALGITGAIGINSSSFFGTYIGNRCISSISSGFNECILLQASSTGNRSALTVAPAPGVGTPVIDLGSGNVLGCPGGTCP